MRALVACLTVAAASTAHAFCGFFVAGNDAKLYNNASQVALLRKGNHTVLTMSNNYSGPPEDFALVVPVPVVLKKEDVKTLPANVFDHVDSLSAPRLVEYWEIDPCRPPVKYKGGVKYEAGGATPDTVEKDHGVKVEAQFVVGEYQIVILSAQDSGGLEAWLHEHKYHIPDGAKTALAPYVREQSKFFVAKVDIKKVQRDAHGKVVLSPLRFGYDANELRLPVRLGLLNAQGKQDLILYVLSPKSRFEAANVPNAFIPTNVEVEDRVRHDFASFYAQLFDGVLAAHQGRVVVTEYAWSPASCDPCPLPPLEAGDLATLGDEPASGDVYGWVLTRLHARYDASTLTEDLVFREAPPVEGGRNWSGGGAQVGAGSNAFQGRYIIRHAWTGPVKCDHPVYGQWGGPPDGHENKPAAAKGLADAPRGKFKLGDVVTSAVPELKLPGKAKPKR
jgi:hypothetical protein